MPNLTVQRNHLLNPNPFPTYISRPAIELIQVQVDSAVWHGLPLEQGSKCFFNSKESYEDQNSTMANSTVHADDVVLLHSRQDSGLGFHCVQ